MSSLQLTADKQDVLVDDTNHDLLHALSVRLDARWHDRSYESESKCDSCKSVFERLRELDRDAIQLLNAELAAHVRSNKFPIDISD